MQAGFYDGGFRSADGRTVKNAYGKVGEDGALEIQVDRPQAAIPAKFVGQISGSYLASIAVMASGAERGADGQVSASDLARPKISVTMRDTGETFRFDLVKRPWATYSHLSIQIEGGKGVTVPVAIGEEGGLYAEAFGGTFQCKIDASGNMTGTYSKNGVSEDVRFGFSSMEGKILNLGGSSAPAPAGKRCLLRLVVIRP